MKTKNPKTEPRTSSRRGFLRNTTLAAAAGSSAVLGVGGRAEAAPRDVHEQLAAYAKVTEESEGSPGSVSVDRFIAEAYPQELTEEDARLLDGALYLQLSRVLERMCDPYSVEEMHELEATPLPMERLGGAYFQSILEETKARAQKDSDYLHLVLEASDKARALDTTAAIIIPWPIIRVIVKVAVKVLIKVIKSIPRPEI